MKKIIVKCRVRNRNRFEKRLSGVDLKLSPVYWQHDRVFVPRGYKGRSNFPRLIMRTEIRTITDAPVYLLSLRRHIEDSGVDVIEDTKIIDYEGMVNIILQLGFKQVGEISRRREELKLSKGTMLYLDTLDMDNSTFVKIETILGDKASPETVKSELISTLRSFGETDIIESTYFEL